MAGQFELSAKHLDNKKQAQEAAIEIQSLEAKEAVKALYIKSYGLLPSADAAYNDYIGLVISVEEIAKTNPLAATIIVDQIVAQEIVSKYSDESFNKDEIVAILCSEPGISSLSGLKTTVTAGCLQGKKLISKEQINADKFFIFANEDGKTKVYSVAKSALNVVNAAKNIAGTEILLNQVEINTSVSDSDCIAVINDNFETAQSIARTLIAAVSLGVGHSALIAGISTAKETKDANGSSISNTQSIQFTLADLFAELESGRMLTYYSADLIDSKKANIKFATMAKVQSSDAAAQISLQALQILGNLGYIANNDFAEVMQVAIAGQVKGGTNRVQKNQIYQYIMAKK